MTRRFAISALPFLGMLLLAASLAAAADDYLKLVPDSAWGFVAVNGPAALDGKLQDLGRQIQVPIPPVLEMFKRRVGALEAWDEKGTLVLLALPAETAAAAPKGVLLVPVTDYAKFLAQLNPESTTDGVSTVKFVNDHCLIRNIGAYAVVSDSLARSVLDSVKQAAEIPSALKPWGAWISSRDVAGVLLQPGIKNYSAKAQAALSAAKLMLGQLGDQGKQAVAVFEMYEKILQAAQTEVSALGIGLEIDKQNTLRVTSRTELIPAGNWARYLAKAHAAKEKLLHGLPDDPFVAAGGSVLSDDMMAGMMKLSFGFMKSMPEIYGLSDEQIGKMVDLTSARFKGVHSMSMVMGAGTGDEPLYANLLGVLRVENAPSFMAGYDEFIKQYNEIIKGAKSPVIQRMEAEKCDIAGMAGYQITMAIPKPPAGPMPPQYDKMMEAMFGPGEKVVFWIAPADEHTIVMGYVNKAPMERAIAALKQNKPGLAADAAVSKTVALLPPDAPMVAYLSPQGTIGFVKRMMSVVLPPGMEERVTIPDFPPTQPLGFAVTTAPNELETTLVLPSDVLTAIAKYVQHIRGMARDDVTLVP